MTNLDVSNSVVELRVYHMLKCIIDVVGKRANDYCGYLQRAHGMRTSVILGIVCEIGSNSVDMNNKSRKKRDGARRGFTN